jgi:hypothetical protein
MTRLMKDELFEAQLLRAMGYAPYGAADAGECLAVAGQISGPSLDSWHDAWMAMAARLCGQAEVSAAAGRAASARGGFFRAANYFRTAGLFAMGAPADPRLAEAHRREVDSFRRGAALLAVPPEVVQIPYEDSFLPGYYFRAAADVAPRATMILVTGYDGTAEELYFTNGAAALERGYNVLAFDGPGQGTMLIDRGVALRPDWENVITPVVDYLLARPDVDPEQIVVAGLSLGGYLAPRGHRRAPGGVIYGLLEFLQRSLIRREHVAGSAAWGQQLALALGTIVILSAAQARHRRRFGLRPGRLWLLAPLGKHAARRVARALGFGSEAAQPGRVLLALPAAALFLFCFWRAGVQVTGGLDPNFTANAWGGPSYAGAMACHYLDLFLLAAGAAWLMDRILPA